MADHVNLGKALQEIVTLSNIDHARNAGVEPRIMLCGCCTFGCICAQHANAALSVPQNICWFHTQNPATHAGDSITALIDMVDSTMAGVR